MSLDVFLQDHFRSIVKPAYTNVYRERGGVLGVVEFDTREDLERAIRKLDDTEFKNPFDRAYIRVIDESDDRGGRSRSRSPRGRSGLCMFAISVIVPIAVCAPGAHPNRLAEAPASSSIKQHAYNPKYIVPGINCCHQCFCCLSCCNTVKNMMSLDVMLMPCLPSTALNSLKR
jgi:hypothetical protein